MGTSSKPIGSQKEIKMFKNRLFNLIVVAVSIVLVALVAQQAFAKKAIVPDNKSAYTESKEQVLREYRFGERYGETRPLVTQFSAEQIRREYILSERYGVTPQQYARDKALREYWLGERYGQRP